MTDTIPEAVLDQPVEGVNLRPGPLRDQLGDGPTLLVFLRHTGCIFCRETVAEVRRRAEADPSFPPVIFFYEGTPDDGRAFFEHFYPSARAVADAPRTFYADFGVARGGLGQLLNPAVVACGIRATLHGHRQKGVTGDPFQMPGTFLVSGSRILWRHLARHAGDGPDLDEVAKQVREGAGSSG